MVVNTENNEINLKVLSTKEDIAAVREDMAKLEARLTMRMFYFWMGQVAVMAGLLSYFFKIRG